MQKLVFPLEASVKLHVCTDAVVSAVQEDLGERYGVKEKECSRVQRCDLDPGGMLDLREPWLYASVPGATQQGQVGCLLSMADSIAQRFRSAPERAGGFVKVHAAYLCFCCTKEEAEQFAGSFEYAQRLQSRSRP